MASKVIVLRGEAIYDESLSASAVITPGDLIEVDSGQWRRHAGAGLNAMKVFAAERDELGKGIDAIAGDYAASDRVKAAFCHSGMRVNAFVETGATIVIGEALESAGDGSLQKLVSDAATDENQRDAIVAYSAEALTTTSKDRVKVIVA